MKKKAAWLCLALLLCVSAAGTAACGAARGTNGETEESIDFSALERCHAVVCFEFNTDDPREVVGEADCAFVGYVERIAGTEYDERRGGGDDAEPYTIYSVRVLENIKGTLPADRPLELRKGGGVYKDRRRVLIYDGDSLPEPGKLYVFIAHTRSGGRPEVFGPNSNIPLEEELQSYGAQITAEQLAGSAVVRTYRDAYENEIPFTEDGAENAS